MSLSDSFHNLFEHMPGSVHVQAADGSVREINSAGLRTLEAESLRHLENRRFHSLVAEPHREAFEALAAKVFRDGDGGALELEVVGLKGRTHWLELHASPVRDEAGTVTALLGVAHDIDERKQAEAELRESEALHRVTLSNISDTVIIADDAGLIRYVCPNVATIFGHSPDEVMALGKIERLLGDHLFSPEEFRGRAELHNIERRITTKGGAPRLLLVNVKHVSIRGGTVLYTCRDVTDRGAAEQALRSLVQGTPSVGNEFFVSLVRELASELGVRYAFVGRLLPGSGERVRSMAVWANGALAPDFEYDLAGTPCANVVTQNLCQYPSGVRELFPEDHLLAEMGVDSYMGTPLFARNGKPLGLLVVLHDRPMEKAETAHSLLQIFASRAATEIERLDTWDALEASEARYRAVVEDQTEFIVRWRPDGTRTFVNEAYARYFGQPRSEIIGTSLFRLIPLEEACEALRSKIATLTPTEPIMATEVRALRADGVSRWQHWIDRGIFDDGGRLVELQSVGRDVHDRIVAEEALRDREERLRMAVHAANVGLWDWDVRTSRVVFSREWKSQLGYADDEVGDGLGEWKERVHPDDLSPITARLEQCLAQPGEVYDVEFRMRHKDGSWRLINARGEVFRDAEGRPVRMLGCHLDITERHQLEAQFRQAQKMDAIGQLAGGVAHDFNNMLCAILLQTNLATKVEGAPAATLEALQEIRDAAQRASALTQQLLLLGRRQVMQPRILDLNEVVANLSRMLERLISEDIRLDLRLHSEPLTIHADPSMLDQVLLNLAVNSRDAMPAGGRLLVETGLETVSEQQAALDPETAPGRYAWLQVTDTGCGISPQVLPHIFEPFFTTKESGKGTGLGLATVFGIVKQHRGWLKIHSEPDAGTRVQIFLPEVIVPSERSLSPEAPLVPRGGTETILLVEDDPATRRAIRSALELCGYRVFVACDGPEALDLWKVHQQEIALLLTDLVMPGGLDGEELAERLAGDEPRLRILFMSGYSAKILRKTFDARATRNYLQKPFVVSELLAVIRRILDQ